MSLPVVSGIILNLVSGQLQVSWNMLNFHLSAADSVNMSNIDQVYVIRSLLNGESF